MCLFNYYRRIVNIDGGYFSQPVREVRSQSSVDNVPAYSKRFLLPKATALIIYDATAIVCAPAGNKKLISTYDRRLDV